MQFKGVNIMDVLEQIFYSATCLLLENKYKQMCINAAIFARLNRDDNLFFNTSIIYAKMFKDKFRKFKNLNQQIKNGVL